MVKQIGDFTVKIKPLVLGKHWLIWAALLAVLLIAAYTIWSFLTWNSYKISYNRFTADLHGKIDKALGLPAGSAEEKVAKLTALKNTSPDIEKAKGSLCSVSGLLQWQTVFPELRQRETACKDSAAKAVAYGDKQQSFVSFLADDSTLARTVNNAVMTVKETDLDAQVGIWQAKIDAVAKQSTSQAFDPVKKEAETRLAAIASGWQEVAASSKAQNRTNYTAAQAKLARAYADLDAISATSSQQLETLVKALQTAYAALPA